MPRPRSHYIPTLDGWRAIAIGGVILSHSFAPTSWAKHGALGVNLFFAISGFLITLRLRDENSRTGHISLRNFYFRRAFRILPSALLFLGAIALLDLAGIIVSPPGDVLSCLLFLRNYWGSDAQHGWYTAHFWSLAVEEQFYLFWPALLVFVGFRRARFVAPALATAVAVWRSLDIRYGWAASMLHTDHLRGLLWRGDYRMDALLWGCALALIWNQSRAKTLLTCTPTLLSIPAIIAAVVALDVAQPKFYMAVQAILFAALLAVTVGRPASVAGRVLEWAPLRFVGRLSYSIYLWQQLFFSHVHRGPAQHFPINLALAIVCATTVYFAVEKPCISWGHRLTSAARSFNPLKRPLLPISALNCTASKRGSNALASIWMSRDRNEAVVLRNKTRGLF